MNDYVLFHHIAYTGSVEDADIRFFRKPVRLPCLPPLGGTVHVEGFAANHSYIVDRIEVADGNFEIRLFTCGESFDDLATCEDGWESLVDIGWTECNSNGEAIAPESNG